MGTNTRRATGFQLLLWAILLVLAVEVALLATENRRLKAALAGSAPGAGEKAAALRERPRLHEGDALRTFEVLAADGTRETVALDGSARGVLLFVFTEQCPACTEARGAWDELVPHFEAAGIRVLGIRLDPGADTGAFGESEFTVVTLADGASVPLDRMSSVPLTLLLDGQGTVRWARYGALDVAAQADVLRILDERR
jgi:peroxiredoxin